MERTGWFHLHYHYHTNFRSHVLVAEDVGIRLEGCPTRKRYLLRFAYAIKWWTLGIQWRKRRMTIKIIKQTTGYQWISIPFQWNDVSLCRTLSHPPPESWKAAFSGGWEDCQTEGWSAAESGLTALTLYTQWAGFHRWCLVTLVARGRWKFPGCRAFQLFVLSSSSGREPSAPWKLEWKDRLVQEEIVFEVSKSYKFIMNLHSYLVKLLDKKYASFLPQPKAQLNQVQLLCCYMCSP